ncbi:hypothetical protein L3Y34_014179 [Caenorhabditis briggsae]|uniref:Solute carrier family 40 member n=3 Tax=Caenorhabditis briggsae TaxID=6238 RepID=A0AAE9IXQ3_CAEBR|nr:hypothetical protein L3Y34_014179 [Caenorhabditis briggsae]
MTGTKKSSSRWPELQLYGAFLLTTLGDRMWSFVIGLFMHQLGGMTWVAVQQLVDSLLKLFGITFIGQFLDKIDRDKIIQRTLLLNNAAVALSALIFAGMFQYRPENYATLYLLIASAIASVSKVASEIQRICFTKDWVVVISRSERVDLSKVNSYLLSIDQASSLALPWVSGWLLDHFPWQTVCLIIIAYNCGSWVLEAYILRNLYQNTEGLKTRSSELEGDEELMGIKDIRMNTVTTYFRQSSWTAGFGLALLYMTVLGFDNLAASYGQKHGLSAGYIGFLRGVGSLLGIAGTLSYHHISKRVGLLWTVMIGLIWQNIFIEMCGVSMLLPGSSMDVSGFIQNTTASQWVSKVVHKVTNPEPQDVPSIPFWEVSLPVNLFFFGIMFARFGLWLADPAITQIQQETIREDQRYMVFSVQLGLNELFSVLKDIIVIMFPFTSLFGALTLGSCAFVFAGFVFNLFYHAQCGFSLTNKNMHLVEQESTEMSDLSDTSPERQSLIGGVSGDLRAVEEETKATSSTNNEEETH